MLSNTLFQLCPQHSKFRQYHPLYLKVCKFLDQNMHSSSFLGCVKKKGPPQHCLLRTLMLSHIVSISAPKFLTTAVVFLGKAEFFPLPTVLCFKFEGLCWEAERQVVFEQYWKLKESTDQIWWKLPTWQLGVVPLWHCKLPLCSIPLNTADSRHGNTTIEFWDN